MKNKVETIIFAVVSVLFVATSCQKEETPVAQTGETIDISIQGGIGDFTLADGAKATTESVIRVMWTENDPVFVYDGSKKLGKLKVSLKGGDARYAYLTNDGEIVAPQAGTKLLTLVYVKGATEAPAVSSGKISLDISTQSGSAFPFMLYATLPFEEGMTEITDTFVPFEFATSVIKVNCANLVEDAGNITFASIDNMNTVCVLSMSKDAAPAVSGKTPGTITRTGTFATGNGKGTFMVAVAPTADASSSTRYINIKQGNESYVGLQFSDAELKGGSNYNTICSVPSKKPADQDCVNIGGIWWTKENLAITDSGKKEFNGTGHRNGDYFQWAAYPGFCGNPTDSDKGLLIYTSFTCKMTDGPEVLNEFHFKDGSKTFDIPNAPYYIGENLYQYYTDAEHVTLDRTGAYTGHNDDVANAILGGSWRMPTVGELGALKEATYCAWDKTDCGCYLFIPLSDADRGHSSAEYGYPKGGTYDKKNAVLFLPAAGYGDTSFFYSTSTIGYYFSSSAYTTPAGYVHYLYFSGFGFNLGINQRYFGYTVRPVSD